MVLAGAEASVLALVLSSMVMAVPMFLGGLLGTIGSLVLPGVFGGKSNFLDDLFKILPQLGAGAEAIIGGAPNAQDLLKDNPWLAEVMGIPGIRGQDADESFEHLRGRAQALEDMRANNLSISGISPAGISAIPGLEFLAGIEDQFTGVDPTAGALALGLKDQERLINQHLAYKFGLDQLGSQNALALSGLLTPAQGQFAGGIGSMFADITQQLGQDDQIEQILKYLQGLQSNDAVEVTD